MIEQLTYLLFIKRLDEIRALAEQKANRTGKPIDAPVFGKNQQRMRWSQLREKDAMRCSPPCATTSSRS